MELCLYVYRKCPPNHVQCYSMNILHSLNALCTRSPERLTATKAGSSGADSKKGDVWALGIVLAQLGCADVWAPHGKGMTLEQLVAKVCAGSCDRLWWLRLCEKEKRKSMTLIKTSALR